MNENAEYYLIKERLVGKKENDLYYLFIDGKWVPDEECMITDRLWGYDPSEPEGSPYRFGSMSIMDEIEDISFEEAMKLTGGNA